MAIKIQKNIPVPPRTRPLRFPFDKMKVGDSFLVKGVKPANLYQSAHTYGRRMKEKFLVRSVDGGVRCWRVE